MVDFMKKIPAGTFVIPMLLSAIIHTFWPDLFNIGGVTGEFLGTSAMNFIIGMLSFCSGIGLKLSSIGQLMKRHGTLLILKFVIAVVLSLLYMNVFGQAGIFGISAVAFSVVMSSINPAVYISIVDDSGTELDKSAFGLTGLFSIPVIPVLIYNLAGSGEINWLSIFSTIFPFILGIILGNLDPDFRGIFSTGITVLLPILGWKIGQTMNLIAGLQSGFTAILLTVIFYLIFYSLVVVDERLLKGDGIAPFGMSTVAGVSASFPAVIAATNPVVAPYVDSATVQIVAVAIITSILTPILVRRKADKQKA